MARKKHRRCGVCNVVTARHVRTQDAGAFKVQVWATDPANGEVLARNGTIVRCRQHANR